MKTNVTSWSFSRLEQYERCPYSIKLKVLDKMPEPPRDPANDPMARGNMIHEQLEKMVRDGDPMPAIAQPFAALLTHLRALYEEGMVQVEQMWAFDEDWNPTEDWKSMWLRMKNDVFVRNENVGIVIDHKTGKRFGKEISHVQQTQLYAGCAALLYPELETIHTEIWYIDDKSTLNLEYTRDQAIDFIPRFEVRAARLLNDTRFAPRPSVHNCRWCDYGPNKTGVCGFGVKGT